VQKHETTERVVASVGTKYTKKKETGMAAERFGLGGVGDSEKSRPKKYGLLGEELDGQGNLEQNYNYVTMVLFTKNLRTKERGGEGQE